MSLLFAVVGWLVGGVVNALADDLPARRRLQRPSCPRCEYVWNPAGFLAINRRLFQTGHCPQCQFPTRRRTWLVELSLISLYALLPLFISNTLDLIIIALYIAILTLIIIIDAEHKLILHIVTLPSTLLALGGSFLLTNTRNNIVFALIGAGIGLGVFFLFYLVGQFVFGPGALGFGDVTLAMTMGAMLGFPYIVFALTIGIILAGLASVLLILARTSTLRTYIPYGVYLALAGIIMLVWGDKILGWYFNT